MLNERGGVSAVAAFTYLAEVRASDAALVELDWLFKRLQRGFLEADLHGVGLDRGGAVRGERGAHHTRQSAHHRHCLVDEVAHRFFLFAFGFQLSFFDFLRVFGVFRVT